jgi:hypothetical protein
MRLSKKIIEFESGEGFNIGTTLCIFANLMCMAAESYQASSVQVAAVRASNTFFTLAFGAESLVRLLSQTPRKYFSSSGAVDYGCVIMSYVVLRYDCLFKSMSSYVPK